MDKSISSINIKKYLLPYLNTEYKTVERNKKDEYVNVKLDYTNS
ncbi:MAG: hypothetical protein P1U46_04635 [Patescibacteria group bacterium]|nr:hypothetical protein [Patescibacteria group bacterium]